MIPPMEVDEGILSILEAGFGATEDEAVNAIARGLGFRSTSSQLKEFIKARIGLLVRDARVQVRDNMLIGASTT